VRQLRRTEHPVEPIRIEDILGRDRYGAQRDAIRRRLTDYKRARRLSVGPHLTFVFEDRVTVWYQIQEMLWVEQITDLDAIREELAIYNATLPGASEFSATLFIEIDDAAQVVEVLNRLVGIDECVAMEVGERPPLRATFEPDRQTAEKVSAVQYVRFPFDEGTRAAIAAGAPLAVRVEHASYRARQPLSDLVRESLATEAAGPAAMTVALARVRDGG
jgi:Protein of unknown function (DUF3501)